LFFKIKIQRVDFTCRDTRLIQFKVRARTLFFCFFVRLEGVILNIIMKNAKKILCSGFLLVCLQVVVSAQSGVANTKYGQVEGYREGNIRIFKGIPFAAPPVGDLRWKAPQPPVGWKGVKKCVAFSASPIQPKPVPFLCWSKEFIAPPVPLSEDCLYLNVWTGATSAYEKRPVFVWIYGGGFISGSAGCVIYDGLEYAKKGIVFVSINYRVGSLGFMAHPELSKEGNGSSGNYGLMDQVAALQWVKENIAAFGGDPSNVTIGGQSAGSISVYALIASPSASGLFTRAIAQSGGIFGSFNMSTLEEGEKTGIALQQKLHAENLKAMRSLPADSILSASSGINEAGRYESDLHFGPVRDGVFLPADLYKAFSEGKFNPVDFLGGWVTGETTMFGIEKISKEKFIQTVGDEYGVKAEKLIALLPHADSAEASASLAELHLLSFAVTSPYFMSRYSSRPAYLYEFSHVPTDKPGFPNYGAFHTADVPFVLGNLHAWDRPWRESDYTIEKDMSSYWIQFIRSGNPDVSGLPRWEPYKTGMTLEFGDHLVSQKKFLYKQLLETMTAD
jgi:para-nitrobenzyl esterase